ncbi:hypothetical protein CC80DRAFT_440955, partial [Byssothecium circinans]
MKVTLLPPQLSLAISSPRSPKSPTNSADTDDSPKPIPYTGSPIHLLLSDLALLLRHIRFIPNILLPLTSPSTTPLDELYPSAQNLVSLGLHVFLLLFQGVFLVTLPGVVLVPLWMGMGYVAAVWGVVWGVSRVLNGRGEERWSCVDLGGGDGEVEREGERWVFLNGVGVGHHWLQSNLNLLALTFRRPILGLHNRTYGIFFDLLQCILERCFCYATTDIRRSYAVLRRELLKSENRKVVLILHSQGGMEGGLILDWLLGELPHDTIHKLEIYTFGSAANHFNNPPRSSTSTSTSTSSSQHCSPPPSAPPTNAVRHIEHYLNAHEFVARWGALTFARLPNRFMGRLFIRPATGHLLNQHYLSVMFPRGEDGRVLDENAFMDMEVEVGGEGESGDGEDRNARASFMEMLSSDGDVQGGVEVVEDGRDAGHGLGGGEVVRVRRFSRLWGYRNG